MAKSKKTAEPKTSAKNLSPLARARAALKGVLKEDPVVPLTANTLRQSMPHLPFGSIIVDYLIGGRPNSFGVPPCPGAPRGRILNLYGNAGAGKTTLALTEAATTCANGGTVVYIDWENEVEPRYASVIGVPVEDESKFLLMQPNTLEEGMKIMVQMAREGVDLIVVDSVGAAVPEDLYEREIGEEGNQTRIGLVAQKWSQFLPKFKSLIAKSGTAVTGISQLRKKINSQGHGPDVEVQGGEAWKFFSAVRMHLRVYSKEKVKRFNPITGKMEEIVVGTTVRAKLDKCKVSDSVHHEQNFFLTSGKGIDNARSVVDIAVATKIINKSGAWYEWVSAPEAPIKAQGIDSLINNITSQANGIQTLFSQVAPKLGATQDAVTSMFADDGDDDDASDLFDDIVPATPKKVDDADLDLDEQS